MTDDFTHTRGSSPVSGRISQRAQLAAFLSVLLVVGFTILEPVPVVHAQEGTAQKTKSLVDNLKAGGFIGFIIIGCSMVGVSLCVMYAIQIRRDELVPPELLGQVEQLFEDEEYEEAMLAANRAVARALDFAERETIHRIHPAPSGQKLAALSNLLDRLGVGFEGDLAKSGVLAKVLDDVKGMPSEEHIHIAALRSMSQARYDTESRGHYALRFDHYVHFTSPIRRYADLEVHRALKRKSPTCRQS